MFCFWGPFLRPPDACPNDQSSQGDLTCLLACNAISFEGGAKKLIQGNFDSILETESRLDIREAVACLQVYGEHVAVHNLSLHLRMGEVTALLGHNGAGASVPSYSSFSFFS